MTRGVWTRLEDGTWGGKIPGDYELGERVTVILEGQGGKESEVTLEIIDVAEGTFEFEGQNIGFGKTIKKKRYKKKKEEIPMYQPFNDVKAGAWLTMNWNGLIQEIEDQQELLKQKSNELAKEQAKLYNLNKILAFRVRRQYEKKKEKT